MFYECMTHYWLQPQLDANNRMLQVLASRLYTLNSDETETTNGKTARYVRLANDTVFVPLREENSRHVIDGEFRLTLSRKTPKRNLPL